MELAHRIVACFPLAEKPDICEQNITVLDLWLRPLFVNSHSVGAFDKVALSERSSYKYKSTGCNKAFV